MGCGMSRSTTAVETMVASEDGVAPKDCPAPRYGISGVHKRLKSRFSFRRSSKRKSRADDYETGSSGPDDADDADDTDDINQDANKKRVGDVVEGEQQSERADQYFGTDFDRASHLLVNGQQNMTCTFGPTGVPEPVCHSLGQHGLALTPFKLGVLYEEDGQEGDGVLDGAKPSFAQGSSGHVHNYSYATQRQCGGPQTRGMAGSCDIAIDEPSWTSPSRPAVNDAGHKESDVFKHGFDGAAAAILSALQQHGFASALQDEPNERGLNAIIPDGFAVDTSTIQPVVDATVVGSSVCSSAHALPQLSDCDSFGVLPLEPNEWAVEKAVQYLNGTLGAASFATQPQVSSPFHIAIDIPMERCSDGIAGIQAQSWAIEDAAEYFNNNGNQLPTTANPGRNATLQVESSSARCSGRSTQLPAAAQPDPQVAVPRPHNMDPLSGNLSLVCTHTDPWALGKPPYNINTAMDAVTVPMFTDVGAQLLSVHGHDHGVRSNPALEHESGWRAGPGFIADKQQLLSAIQQDAGSFHSVPNELRCDRDVVLASIAQRMELSLYDVPVHFFNDKEILLNAVRIDPHVLQHASDNLKSDRAFMLEAVKSNGLALEFAADQVKADRDIVLAAVQQDGSAMQYASASLWKDEEVRSAQRFVPNPPSRFRFVVKASAS